MSQLSSAGIIANLEGRKGLALPSQANLSPTLTLLDRRTRVLENEVNISPPLALLEPTWETLAWRVCRLNRRVWPKGAVSSSQPSTVDFVSLVPDVDDISLDKIQAIITDIKQFDGRLFSWPSLDLSNDENGFTAVVQRLCYVAGSRAIKITNVPTNVTLAFALALEVALELDAPRFPPPPGIPPPPGWLGPRLSSSRKSCCGCCTCSCHSAMPDRSRSDDTESYTIVGTRSRVTRLLRFGWLRKLLCWKQGTTYDGESSVSSR